LEGGKYRPQEHDLFEVVDLLTAGTKRG